MNAKTEGDFRPFFTDMHSVDCFFLDVFTLSLHVVHEMNAYEMTLFVCPHDSTLKPVDGCG
jgi:hypothetical protein